MHSDSYIVLARKWRPAQFKDIVGQTHIVRTLTNAIQLHRVHQAYLFTGSRGIGKTSIARIFSKIIRCEFTSLVNDIIQSCDSCASCKEISLGNSVDVVEIDGASNNGVDAVREIRENVKYMPASGSRKIYIIDEVHMLTTAAFNALLKTLEEPPAHVIFIFATTEPHKIPATVLSRCQRFDYRRVTIKQIQTRLAEIARSEGISIEPGALALIGRSAEGSMRDALSLLDQVIAFSGALVSIQSVRESIGIIDGQVLIKIINGIFSRMPISSLEHVEKVYEQGHDLRLLARNLIEFLHAIILIKIGSSSLGGLEISEEEANELAQIAKLRSLEEMELIFQVLHHGVELIARSPQPKIVLNVLLIKCATSDALISLEAPLQTNHIEKQKEPQIQIQTEHLVRAIREPVQAAGLANFSDSRLPKVNGERNFANAPSLSVDESLTIDKTKPPIGSSLSNNWEGLVDHIRKSRPLLASILEHSSGTLFPQVATSSNERNLVIYFSPEEAYFREQLQSRIYQEQLSNLSKEYLGFSVRLQVETRTSGESVVARREREQTERKNLVREQAIHHPIITEAKSLFGGELSPIDLKEDQHAAFST